MKKLLVSVAALALATPLLAQTAPLRVAVIDVQKVLQTSTLGKAAYERLKKLQDDRVAKMQKMDEATLIANTTAMLQIALIGLGDQAFTSEVVNSLATFLKDPKSLTVELKPAQPVTVQQLMGADVSKPRTIIDLLGLHVTAND